MRFFLSSLAFLVTFCCAAIAKDPGLHVLTKAIAGDEMVNVDVWLALEHVPRDLKAGMTVDLSRVNGKTSTSTGLVHYTTVSVTRGCEVISISRVDKPKDPEQAVMVTLSVTKSQAALIETIKSRLITVVETESGGKSETRKKPVTLRLELPKSDKK